MESKNLRVMFSNLEDAKLVMVLVASDANQKYRAYKMLQQMGTRPNSAGMAEARRDNIATLELLLSISEEFERLHVDCPCPTTPEEVSQGLVQLRERIAEIKADDAAAGPVDTDPVHAQEDLMQFLGATGLPVPEGFDRQEIPGLSYGNGTGMYL